jgi:tellurite resistance protein TehA-like permease
MTTLETPRRTLGGALNKGVENLFPGYFAMVMATGIVSIAAWMAGMRWLAWPLFYLNNVFFIALWVMLAARVAKYPRRVISDLADHVLGPGFFTVIAGTCVFGNQYLLMAKRPVPALGMWWVSVVLGAVMIYTFAAAMTTRDAKPALDGGLHGGWLMLTVASQAVSLLGTSLSGFFAHPEVVLLFTMSLYLIGGMFYIMLISLIFYRWMFFKMDAAKFTPLYWVNMGAVAITTRAGLILVERGGRWSVLGELVPFMKGFTLFFWASATWWIPLLTILMVWRHVAKRVPLRYEPQFWGMVFTMGMYTVCTFELVHTVGLPFLSVVPSNFVYVAIAAWLTVSIGMARNLAQSAREVF